MGGMQDRTGRSPLRQFSHVRITNVNHGDFGRTGTVVRLDQCKRKVWVALPDGAVVAAGHRSVEVIVPGASDKVQ